MENPEPRFSPSSEPLWLDARIANFQKEDRFASVYDSIGTGEFTDQLLHTECL